MYGISETELKSPSQNRNISEARAVAGWLAQDLGCVTLSEVGRFVNRDVESISSAVRRLSDRMQEMPKLAERIRSIKTTLG
jgi:putative transposase